MSTVLEVNQTPYGRGSLDTEKFTIPDNSYIYWTCFKKRFRLLPIIPRSSAVKIYLLDPETRRVQKKSMPSNNGKIVIRRNNEGSAVIHRGGTYYLNIRWGSWVKKFVVRVDDGRRVN